MAHYYPEPRKKYSAEAIAKWTENSRKQDRTNHPFVQRNRALGIPKQAAFNDALMDAEQELSSYGDYESVDGNRSWAEQILDELE